MSIKGTGGELQSFPQVLYVISQVFKKTTLQVVSFGMSNAIDCESFNQGFLSKFRCVFYITCDKRKSFTPPYVEKNEKRELGTASKKEKRGGRIDRKQAFGDRGT